MESSLSAAYADLQGDVGFYLGYGRGLLKADGTPTGDPAYTTQQQQSVDRCVKGGLRRFYFCGYDWSFLKPTATVDLPVNAQTIPLSDDFGGFEGQLSLFSTVSQIWWPIDLISEGKIRQMYSAISGASGRPLFASLQPLKGTGPTQGQRWQLFMFPQADADYTLQFQYYILPDYLSGAFPYAYGGAQHSETLLAACKAVAELELDDMMGPQEQNWQTMLAKSMDIDRRSKPQNLGYNRDQSDWHHRGPWRPDLHGYSPIHVNGVLYALLVAVGLAMTLCT